MNLTPTLLLALTCASILPSCQTTDDPRAGGLWGYMATGDAGYQRRIMERQGHLDHLDSSTAAANASSRQLQSRKSSLLAQKSRLSSLRSEAMGLTGGVSLAGRIHRTEQNAENIGNLQSQIDKLAGEVAALRRRQ